MSANGLRTIDDRFWRATVLFSFLFAGACNSDDGDKIDAAAAKRGAVLAKDCVACHSLTSKTNEVGPYLVGIVGRDIASARGFKYSDALLALDGNWNPERLAAFIHDPTSMTPGTMMAYNGISKDEARDIVEHLRSLAR